MALQPITLEDGTKIRYCLQMDAFEKKRISRRVLVAQFIGDYRPGHQGTPDAFFIQAITHAALRRWHPDGLVLDLRQLSYTWGDDMEEVLGVRGEIPVPFAVVGSDRCLPAIGTLIQTFYGSEKIANATKAENIFDQIEEAIEYVHEKV